MDAIISLIGLLNIALGFTHTGGGFGGETNYRGYSNRVYKNGFVLRDAPEHVTLGTNVVTTAIKLLLGNHLKVSVNVLKENAQKIKSNAQAQLDKLKEIISEEQVNTVLKEMTAKSNHILTIYILHSGVLLKEAYRVTLALQLLKNCAEEIERRQEVGRKYGVYLKIITHVCDIIIAPSARVVGIHNLGLLKREQEHVVPQISSNN